MALRTKLVVSFTLLLLFVVAAVGLVAYRSIESIMVDQIDRVLVGFQVRGPGPGLGPAASLRPDRGETAQPSAGDEVAPDGTVVLRRDTAEVWLDSRGEIVFSLPSGFVDDPDPLPDVTNLPDTAEPVDISSVDGTLTYRAVIFTLPGGVGTLVRAFPLTIVHDATSALVRTLILAGAGVLLLGAAATWWTVDRSMSPVENMASTAEAIAAGDLTRRVPELDPSTELGRLSGSINLMLTHIEDSVRSERMGQERLRQFVADASHELRTPITAIAGYAELRRRGGFESAEAEDNAWTRIEAESRRMASLIEDLIMLTRLGQSQPLNIEEVDLARIATDAAADHAAIDHERPVVVEGNGPVMLRGDRERLHQVVSSLLANTRVHTPPGTTVRVETRDAGDAVELEVSDDGPGIPEASLEHVFDRFYRADPSRSRRSGGSGLGLAIVEAIVKAHDGTVAASSGKGLGATFTVSLPKEPSASTHTG